MAAFGLFEQWVVGTWARPTISHPDQYPWLVNGVEREFAGWVGNDNQVALDYWGATWVASPLYEPILETGFGALHPIDAHHYDYHYRIWVIPSSLNLSNPTIGADIPFTLWNTFPVPETLLSIGVVGSSVLTFDITPGDSILDFQLLLTNFQIGAGEPTIDAVVNFNFTDGPGVLSIRALVASTFTLIPEVPINEEWEFITDTLMTWDGSTSRLSLVEDPRVSLDIKITLVDYQDRRELYDLTKTAIRVPSLVPLFQYAAPLTATAVTGDSRLYFDPKLTNMRVGVYLAAINRLTRQVVLGLVNTIYTDGVSIDTAIGFDLEVDPALWFVMPALPCYIEDGAGVDFGTQAGSFAIKAQALTEFSLVRPDSTRVVNTFDGLPVLEWQQLITTKESFSYRRDLMDGGVGTRNIRSRDLATVISRTFKFSVDRLSDDLDYFRTFFSQVRGSQKPFLKSTQLPDLELGASFLPGASTLVLDRTDYVAKHFPYDAFKRLEISYPQAAKTYHVVTSASIDAFGVASITISPALINDADHSVITRISYLQKLTASDTVKLEHYNDYSYVKFNAKTVEA